MNVDNGIDENEGAVDTDQLWVSAKMDNIDVKAGKMPVYLGKGLLSDTVAGLNGLQVGAKFDATKVMGFYCKDYINTANTMTAADLGTSFNNVNFGAS